MCIQLIRVLLLVFFEIECEHSSNSRIIDTVDYTAHLRSFFNILRCIASPKLSNGTNIFYWVKQQDDTIKNRLLEYHYFLMPF